MSLTNGQKVGSVFLYMLKYFGSLNKACKRVPFGTILNTVPNGITLTGDYILNQEI